MATRDSSRVKRRRARLHGYRPHTHPKHSGRKAGDALDRLSRAQIGRPTTDARVAGQGRLGGEP
jgi:hypothetical protein